jgi:hypothetical protein
MQVKKIKPKDSLFKYNPLVSELVLTVGMQFYYNYETQQWELNQDDYGDPDLVPIKNVVLNEAATQLNFEAKYRGTQQQFEITASLEPEKILLNFFAQFNGPQKFDTADDVDDMEMNFEKGKLETLQIYKHTKELSIVDSLRIKGGEGRFSMIKQKPWRKFDLDSIEVRDSQIISKSGKELFNFHLDLQPVFFNTVKKLLDQGTAL